MDELGPMTWGHSRWGHAVWGGSDDQARIDAVFEVLFPSKDRATARRNELRDGPHVAFERTAHTAADHMVNVYDATFVDLALQRGLPLLTGDAKSSRAVASVVEVEVLS